MIRFATVLTACIGLAALAGCGSSSSSTPDDSTHAQQQEESAADQGTTQAVDAATEAVIANSTGTSDGPVTNRLGQDRLTFPHGYGPATTVSFAALVDSNGNRLYPNLSGSVSITTSGSVVSSWPTGSSAQGLGEVQLSFTSPVTYTDPLCGAKATITAGTVTFYIATMYTWTSTGNWVLGADTETVVPPATPITWTVTKPNGKSHAVSLSGYRHVNWQYQRSKNLPSTDSLQVTRTIDGAPESFGGSPVGQGAQPLGPPTWFTNWTHDVDNYPAGGWQSIWNRNLQSTVTWNFILGQPLRTVNHFAEQIIITRTGGSTTQTTSDQLGVASGPTGSGG